MNASRILEVTDHNPRWKDEFELESSRLANTFQAAFVESHHIGSTSVPGLAAKPTIDIAIELSAGTVIPDYYPNMESLGYVCRGECLDAPIPGVPGRFYFVKYDGPRHLIHVHAYETGHFDLREKLILRDYLRNNKKAASKYGDLKKDLVGRFSKDNLAYMRGKDQAIERLIGEAEQWAIEGDT